MRTEFVVGLLISIFFASVCQAAPPTYKIALVLWNLDKASNKSIQRGFTEEAKNLGFEPVFTSSENDQAKQIAKFDELIAQKVNAIVVQPIDERQSRALIAKAHEAKIPVIALEAMISNSPVDHFVSTDYFKAGVVQAEAAAKATKGEGNLVILAGEFGHSRVGESVRGIQETLKKYPNINIVGTRYLPDWGDESAAKELNEILRSRFNQVHAVLAINSQIARGAIRSIGEKQMLGKIFVAGADADLWSMKEILSGRQQLEILGDAPALGRAAAKVAMKLAKGEKPKGERSYTNGDFRIPMTTTPVIVINAANIEDRIFKAGIYSKAEVSKK